MNNGKKNFIIIIIFLTIIFSICIFLDSMNYGLHIMHLNANFIGGVMCGFITLLAMIFIDYLQKKRMESLEKEMTKRWVYNSFVKAQANFILEANHYYYAIKKDFSLYTKLLEYADFENVNKKISNFEDSLKESINKISNFKKITPVGQFFENKLFQSNNINIENDILTCFEVFYEQIIEANQGTNSTEIMDKYKLAVENLILNYITLDSNMQHKQLLAECLNLDIVEDIKKLKTDVRQFILGPEFKINIIGINKFYNFVKNDLTKICNIYSKEMQEYSNYIESIN